MKKSPKSRRFLFVSRWGDLLDIVNTVQSEGNEVKMFIEHKGCREVGDGFVPKVRKWQSHIDWADVIVFDYTGYGKEASELRAAGKYVFGGNEYTDNLELDRSFGQSELKKHKINILKFKEFSSFKDAIAYVEANPKCYVIKPSGETQEYKQLLFVGQEDDGSDVIRMLKAYEKSWGEMASFQLQRRVKGVEVSSSAFFNGKEFLKPVNITFEHKKLFPKELGVSTGEMGTSMFWVDESPLFDETLKLIEKKLAETGFCGHIDLNCIVNGKGIYPLEFTSRFGFPQLYIQRAGIIEHYGEMLYKIASGVSFKIKTRPGFQVGVYMVVPPFPYDDKKTFELFSKDAVVIFKDKKMNGIHPVHVKLVNGEWLITGDSGMPLLVTGTGQTMREAQRTAYSRISNVLINNAYYRIDIGDRWLEDSDKLWTWGYL